MALETKEITPNGPAYKYSVKFVDDPKSIEDDLDKLHEEYGRKYGKHPSTIVVSLNAYENINSNMMKYAYYRIKDCPLAWRNTYILYSDQLKDNEALVYPKYNKLNGLERAICRLNDKNSKKAT